MNSASDVNYAIVPRVSEGQVWKGLQRQLLLLRGFTAGISLFLLAVSRCYFAAAVAKNREFPRPMPAPRCFFAVLSAVSAARSRRRGGLSCGRSRRFGGAQVMQQFEVQRVQHLRAVERDEGQLV